ncbi:MAG: glycerol-3-phosphate dehydrogenase/oxidase [Bdellovibrionaceae bacterium]|nr:glycerol-3-phosphate dehydrogenase/oxidase [Pseudobdellovibrionaceae bacterium]
MSLSFKEQDATLKSVSEKTYDLLIIGGGINGVGIARDASMRGLSVLCVEQSDLASGTSSRSSKLVHGGLRYLENFEFGLVFEALNERAKLLKMAPHLVHPLRFVIPLYAGDRVSPFKMKMGMVLYDILSLYKAPKAHEYLTAPQTFQRVKNIRQQDLKGAFVYSDAYMDDDRLVIETARSAKSYGAEFLTFVKAQKLNPESLGRGVKEVELLDTQTGVIHNVRARHVVSTVGPWTDQVGETLLPDWKPRMRPTKGVHLTLSRMDFPLEDAVVMAADQQKRIIFAIPRHEMVIIGTTDTDYSSDPSQVRTTQDDVEYLLKIVEEYFPEAKVTKETLVSTYSGVRPLVNDGSGSASKVSREHTIISDPRGVTFLMGGKYTTYRLMAQQTVDVVLKQFSKEERRNLRRASTAKPLNPKVDEKSFKEAMSRIHELENKTELTHLQCKMLVERHGLEAWDIVEYGPYKYIWEYEAAHAVRHTYCARLVDFYTRRVPLFLSKKDHGFKFLNRIGKVFKDYYGWDQERLEQEYKLLFDHYSAESEWKGLTGAISMDKIEYI